MTITLNNQTFKKINYNTKKAKYILHLINRSYKTSLYECYHNVSTAKHSALNRCITKAMKACKGIFGNYTPMYILGYNCSTFSCGCVITVDKKQYALYFTYCYDYIIPIED